MTTILVFLGILVILIIIHELGHFLTAKAHKVKVLEFGLGFPPQLLSFPRRKMVSTLSDRVAAFQRDDTVYSLNVFPFGGFVRLAGEDSMELRVLVKCASPEDIEAVRQAFHNATASLSQDGGQGKLKLTGIEVGPVNRGDLAAAKKEKAEILALDVPIEQEAAPLAQRSRIKVTLAEAPLALEEAVQRFASGFALEVQHSLTSKGILTRAVILAAGSFMNFMLPLVIFAAIFTLPQKTLEGRVQIQGVTSNSPAALAGIRPGDVVLGVDGHSVANTGELVYRTRLKLGKSSTWDLLREKQRSTGPLGSGGDPGLAPAFFPAESERLSVQLVPRWKPPKANEHVGVLISTLDGQIVSRTYPPWEAVPKGFVRMGETLTLFRNEIIGLVIGSNPVQVTGVVGIAQITGEVAKAGFSPVLELMALLSLNLAVLNILPIPALDGGRLMFVLLEWIRRGKRIAPEREGLVHLVGFAVLISLVVVISYFDILRIIQGESLLR